MLFRWSRALFALVQLFPSLGIISGTMDTLQFIYLTHELNLLFYIVPISGLSWKLIEKPCELLPKKNLIDSLHTKFLKQILGLQTQTHNIGVFLETGRIPLMAFARKSCIKNWNRIAIEKNFNPIVQLSYENMLENGIECCKNITYFLET